MVTASPSTASSRSLNFDALRFWAALTVLWSHCLTILDGNELREPLHALSRGQSNLGVVAVAFFFAISGYLITRSFDRSPDVSTYIRARLLRIMPAFLVVLALQELVLGPLSSTLPLHDYWRERDPLRVLVLAGLFLREVGELPGVFQENPRALVNGSLWTLRYEVVCYALILALGVTRLLNRRVTLALFLVAVGWMAYFEHTLGLSEDPGLQSPGPDRLFDLGSIFLAGSLIYLWKIPLRGPYAFVCAVLLLASPWLGELRTAQRTVLPYLVLYLAIALPVRLPGLRSTGDLSYGIYLYAWPATQCMLALTHTTSWLWLGVLTTVVTLPLAWLSWHLVEKRALQLKNRAVAAPPLAMMTDEPGRQESGG